MTDERSVFCGKCGTPNPAENHYCRRCGHRLADDIVEIGVPVEPQEALKPISPVEGVEIERYPLVDPESGETIEVEPPSHQDDETPVRARRGSVILWSLGIHFIVISLLGLATLVVMAQLTTILPLSNPQDLLTPSEDLRLKLLLFFSGPVLLGFFVSGVIAGRLWRPQQLLDVGLAGLMLGGLCSLCLSSPMVWPLAFALSLIGTWLGRRWR